MKTKEIINGSSRIEDDPTDDNETTTKTTVMIGGGIITSMDYDDVDGENGSKLGIVGVGGGNVDDIVYHRNNKNSKYNASMGKLNFDDYRYFGGRRSMVDNDGYLISDQHYCNCGGGGAGGGNNEKKSSWSTRSSVKNTSPPTNFYEIDQLMYNEIFEMENGIAVAAATAAAAATSAVYATKKSLMLNEFLELNDHHRSVQHYYVNDAAATFVNKFVSSNSNNATNGSKCRTSTRSNSTNANLDVLPSVEPSTLANTTNGFSLSSSSPSSNTSSGATNKGCGASQTQSHSLCLTSSTLLSDKRLVGLFRSVALYWFFCLNTVLAKGDHVFKRKAATVAVSPLHGGEMNEFAHHKSLSSVDNLQLKICCPDVVLAVVGRLDSDNFLWDLAAAASDEGQGEGGLLSWAEHSKSKLFDDLFEKVLRNLADNCGIFTTSAAAAGAKVSNVAGDTTQFKNQFEKMVESRKPVEPKAKTSDSQERRNQQPVQPKKLNRSGVSAKKMLAVRRKYIIDVLDYYYDEEDDDDADENEDQGGGRAPRAQATVAHRVIWKKRAVKNKQKSKRKSASIGGEHHQRVQQIIIECYGGSSTGCDYVINDGYEEVVGTCEDPPATKPAPPAPTVIVEDEEMFLDFDSYAENLKREVALRQLRKRKQPPASHRVAPASKMEPPRILKCAESGTEDELSGTASTSSSLVLELEEESASYFLPDGRFHSATQKYPKYDLWCSPLVMEKVWPVGEAPLAAQPPPPTKPQQSSGAAGRISKHTKQASATQTTSAAPAPAAASFKPYRLWESSWAPEDDFIPSFVAARRHSRSPKFASMTNAQPQQPAKAPAAAKRPMFGKELAPQSMYTLWGSPNIIDFLPGAGGSSASSSSVRLNGAGSCSSGGDASSSPEEFSSLEYDYSSAESLEILNATATSMNHHFNVRAGKFLSLKPIINGFVSFTDRGAFKYYKKPTAVARPTVISVAVRSSRQSIDRGMKITTEDAVEDVAALDVMDTEDVDGAGKCDYDTPFYFKPIQPAFKVRTDTPATFERSDSGTLWCNKKKLMTFKHELDDVPQPQSQPAQPRRDSAAPDLDSFQPKFAVNGNDVGCQTDWYGLNGFDGAMMTGLASSSSFFGPIYEKRNSQDPSYVSGAALFYAWDEVFNFLNKPGLGNIDVKAHLDFSCFF